MPKFEAKVIQKELEKGIVWPVYWLYGSERMKSRELLKRIRKVVLESETAPLVAGGSIFGLAEETIDGTGVEASSVVEAAQSPSLGGGTRLIVVRDAHTLKNAEELAELLGPPQAQSALASVCVFLSKDFDSRKKISKLLNEKAAVVPCEEVPEAEREAWIGYLAKKSGIALSATDQMQLASLDPWSLDIIDQELEKLSLSREGSGNAGDVLIDGVAPGTGSESFLDSFFARNLKQSLVIVEGFAHQPELALPLLGLFSWNVRHIALILADQKAGTRVVKLSPYVADRLRAYSRAWSLKEILELQKRLQEVDFGVKQTPLLPVGLWGDLCVRFCRA